MNQSTSILSPGRANLRKAALLLLPLLFAAAFLFSQVKLASSAGGLTVTILSGDNLVVDSNATSPATYAPSVATVAGKFCNTSVSPLTNVWGYIGDFAADTPGTYPGRSTTDSGFLTSYPELGPGPFTYRFQHLGGSMGLSDASRYIGDIPAGECRVQYWHFTYPQCENNDALPCDGGNSVIWGETRLTSDDLWLNFDIWSKGDAGAADNKTKKITMRNEISAMANKIEPNPAGRWFNTNTSTVYPGDIITSNGVLYDLGNINKGFDNDGDLQYDYNAWMQPVGDASYDPSCFRLIRTTGVLTISRSGGNAPMILNFTDQLYFTNLPDDNNGAIGNVYYTFMALNGACFAGLSPYQEVASGANNEKFNADFGAGIPPLGSNQAQVTISKTSTPNSVALGTIYTYNIPFQNTGPVNAGLTMSVGGVNMPLVISDTLPVGLEYIANSAQCIDVTCTILYSVDSGKTFSTTDPGTVLSSDPNARVVIQWWLDAPLAPLASGTARFQSRLPAGPAPAAYSGPSLITNTACAQFGNAAGMACDSTITMQTGTNSIGDRVWGDTNNNGGQDVGENGLPNITVWLYYDANDDQVLDDGDVLIQTAVTNGNATGANYTFSNLPDGSYIVKVDTADADLPVGYGHTTVTSYAINDLGVGIGGAVANITSDFGFGPSLSLNKTLVTPNPAGESGLVTFNIAVTNKLPGDGSGSKYCRYKVWAGGYSPLNGAQPPSGGNANSQWASPQFALGEEDGLHATSSMANLDDLLGLNNFTITGAPFGAITKVEMMIVAQESAPMVPGDSLDINLWNISGSAIISGTYTYPDSVFTQPLLTRYQLVANITAARPWNWSDFQSNLIGIQLVGNNSASAGASIGVDAAAFIITTDAECGGSDNVITTLPLADTYDADRLQFVSASPVHTGNTTGGNTPYANTGDINWANVGPLYPGQTKNIQVTFKALQPATEANVVTTNTAAVALAEFGNGRPVNDASDPENVTIEPRGSIGDRLWWDVNANTTDDVGEPGLPNVRVRLCNTATCGTTVYAETRTDANGNYLFEGLANGTTYYVVVDGATLPGGTGAWTRTYDLNGVGTPDVTAAITINNTDGIPGNNDQLGADFGYDTPNAILTGNVWEDNNADGTVDSGENPIGSVTVSLRNAGPDGLFNTGDDIVTTTSTDSLGNYAFAGLVDGRIYRTEINIAAAPLGAGWTNTYDTGGVSNDNISAPITVNIATQLVYSEVNFGYRKTGSATIGDTLFRDWNGDGNQDAGETGIEDVDILLYEDIDNDGVIDPAVDALIARTPTSSTGTYSFANLPAGNFLIKVDTTDPQFPGTVWPQTGDPDSRVDGQATQIVIVGANVTSYGEMTCAVPGTCNNVFDFGYQPSGSGSIGDLVWRDNNANGLRDASEPGLANITVNLYVDNNNDGIIDANDALVATTFTDANGAYLFDNLPAGNFLVQVDETDADLPLDGFGNRFVLSTSDGSTINGGDNNPLAVTLTAGQDYLQADFGFARAGIIGDQIFYDNNGDGSQSTPSESGIAGVTVELYRDSNRNGIIDVGETVYATQVTDSNGQYLFTGVISDTYIVKVITATLPGGGVGFIPTGDPNATTVPCAGAECDNRAPIVLKAGQTNLTADFGYRAPGSIGDFVWRDNNGNGVQDPGEPGLANVDVQLCNNSDCSSIRATTYTDGDGLYSFANIPDGTYYVRIPTPPAGTANTFDGDATLNSFTTIIISGGNITQIGSTPCSSCNSSVDFGYQLVGPNTISGTVFFDKNQSGSTYQNTPTDSPIGGVSVSLYDGNNVLIATTLTDPTTGLYSFGNLPNGTYSVGINTNEPQLKGLGATSEPDEPNCTANPGNCNNRTTFVVSGPVTNLDFGFYAVMDCGDLPASYNTPPGNYRTDLSNEGPCHIRPIGLLPADYQYLGSIWDAEADGQPNSRATGDDVSGTSDEDGFTPVSYETWDAGETHAASITVAGSNNYVAAWFDWNDNGYFVDTNTGQYETGEYVYFGKLAPGVQTVYFTIPASSGCCNTPTTRKLNVRVRSYVGFSPPPSISPTGNVENGEVEDYQFGPNPTSVELADFKATVDLFQVKLDWQTASEIDVAGYNLYRATGLYGERQRLNDELIATKGFGGLMGADYDFIDTNIQPGQTYYYWLEVVDSEGARTMRPVMAQTRWLHFLPVLRK